MERFKYTKQFHLFCTGVKHSVTLWDDHRLQVLKNRVLRIRGHKREEATGGWRRLLNDDLHSLYPVSNIMRVISWRIRWERYVAHEGYEKCTKHFIQKLEGNIWVTKAQMEG
jgi:hypothetical protein